MRDPSPAMTHYPASGALLQLTEAVGLYRTVVESLPDGVLVHDQDGNLVVWNASAETLLGGAPSKEATHCFLAADGSLLDRDELPARVTLRTGVPMRDVVLAIERVGKGQAWLSANTMPLSAPDDSGIVGVITTLRDVTAQLRSQHESELLALAARRTAEVVIISDGSGRVQWVNEGFTRLLGWTLEDMVGRLPGDRLVGPETNADTTAAIYEARRLGTPFNGEILNYRRDGTSVWLELTISPVRDERQRVTHHVCLAHDITARRSAARRMFQLSAAIAATDDGIAIADSFQEFRFANDAFARLFGHERGDDFVGKSWRSIFDEPQLKQFDEVVFPNLWTGDRWRGEVTGRRQGGMTFPAEISLTLIPGGSTICVLRDITERKRREAEQGRLIATLEATPDLVAISSAAGDIEYVNGAGRAMLGLMPNESVKLGDVFPGWARDVVYGHAIPEADERGVWSGETALKRRDGSEIPVSHVLVAHQGAAGAVEYYSSIMRDVTDRKETEEALRRMSLQDQLTGLYNRRGFILLAQQALNTARRSPGHCILLYFDLNDFKQINDRLGHHTGDEALQEFAQVLRESFRESDVIGRLGGDEFVALAVGCLDETGQVLVNRLDERLAAHNATPERRFQLSVGRGMARFIAEQPKNLQQLLEEADGRLYQDKRRRKAARAGGVDGLGPVDEL